MPIAPTYPGVYVEEIPSGVRTISGVATSVTAFIGRALRGPADTPVVVNSFGEFERIFGGLWAGSMMSYAVRDFFQNGGGQAVIVRVASGAAPARIALVRGEPKYLRRIPVKSTRDTTLISTEHIDWIGSAGHYLELHVGGETHLIREQLSRLEAKLDPERFVRIHRSVIVNVDRIKSLRPLFNGDHVVVLKDGRELNLSRTYHEKLMGLLSR